MTEIIRQDGFAADTRIVTQRGEVPIAMLRPGDEAVAMRFAGLLRVARITPRRDSAATVRLRPSALGIGRPHADAVLGADQLLALRAGNGHAVMVPAGALVNGATILADPAEDRELWRIELADAGDPKRPAPDIVMIEGMTACSSDWPDEAANQAVVSATRVDLLAQARVLGWRLVAKPDMHLVVDGRRLDPVERAERVFAFAVPAGAASVLLCSRSACPAEVELASTDRRRLGVAISRITLDGKEIGLDDPRLLSGFHAIEGDGERRWRWTDGDAVLEPNGPGLLELTVHLIMKCWVFETPSPFAAAVHEDGAARHAAPAEEVGALV